jgi:hypothetical protein
MRIWQLLVWCLALCLATPSAAFAQEPPSIKESLGTGMLRGLYFATPTIHAIEGISTLRVVKLGGREVNPLVAPQTRNPLVMVASKAGIAAAEIYLTHRVARDHKFRAILMLTGLNVGYALAAAHNFDVARAMQGRSRAAP